MARTGAARRFSDQAVGTTKVTAAEVVTDRAATYPMVLEELLPAAWHRTDRNANNRVEGDHGRLKARLRSMRGLKQDHSVRVIVAGRALVQNVRRGHYELAVEEAKRRLAVAFDELVWRSDPTRDRHCSMPRVGTTQHSRTTPFQMRAIIGHLRPCPR